MAKSVTVNSILSFPCGGKVTAPLGSHLLRQSRNTLGSTFTHHINLFTVVLLYRNLKMNSFHGGGVRECVCLGYLGY